MENNCCKVCGTKLNIEKGNVYVAQVVNNFFHFTENWNATDCPYCGCQNLLKIRHDKESDVRKRISESLKILSERSRKKEGEA